ncbi:flagellar biosynthesis protein FlgJ [Jannaschia sp. AI_61]|uniref:flagellar biosynthesis protein FlgJ n=1 Tax=Jannaschia sp. AI_61 TaxID=2829796 RepID=UPI001C7D68ED|nr:flagellar biosynthesis protein FlgJ [Jannaschia sp. AI_61]
MTPLVAPPSADAREAALRDQATAMETFLFKELLRASGTGAPSITGERSQFDSFLQEVQAQAVASSGQTGLAEAIYRSMAKTLG